MECCGSVCCGMQCKPDQQVMLVDSQRLAELPSIEQVKSAKHIPIAWLQEAKRILQEAEDEGEEPGDRVRELSRLAKEEGADGADDTQGLLREEVAAQRKWANAVVARVKDLALEQPSDAWVASSGPEGESNALVGTRTHGGTDVHQGSKSAFQGAAGDQNAAVNFNSDINFAPHFDVPFSTRRGRHFWYFCNFIICSSGYKWRADMQSINADNGHVGRPDAAPPQQMGQTLPAASERATST